MMRLFGGGKRDVLVETAIIGGLIGVQFIYAGYSVLLSYLLRLGLHPLSLIVYTSFATFLVLLPVSIIFERTTWPKKCTSSLLLRLFSIALGGVTLFQILFLKGIKLTSPAMATAMPNLAPGFIFTIAWTLRLERVKISCFYSKMKIIGTLGCMVGAIIMSLLQSTTSENSLTLFDKQKIIGCLYLLGGVFVLAINIILQATTLVDFPAPMSLCGITSFIGAALTAIIELIVDHKLDYGSSILSLKALIGYSLLAGVVGGVCVSFNGWAIKRKGPVLVSVFSPVGTVCSIVLSSFTLGYTITLWSMAGMMVMFSGLYLVMWAKAKEGLLDNGDVECEYNDVEKPLLL